MKKQKNCGQAEKEFVSNLQISVSRKSNAQY